MAKDPPCAKLLALLPDSSKGFHLTDAAGGHGIGGPLNQRALFILGRLPPRMQSEVTGLSERLAQAIRANGPGAMVAVNQNFGAPWFRDIFPLITKDPSRNKVTMTYFVPQTFHGQTAQKSLQKALKKQFENMGFEVENRMSNIHLDGGNIFVHGDKIYISKSDPFLVDNDLGKILGDRKIPPELRKGGLSKEDFDRRFLEIIAAQIETDTGKKVVYLPELPYERTGHLDMFLSFAGISSEGKPRLMVSGSNRKFGTNSQAAVLDRISNQMAQEGFEIHRVEGISREIARGEDEVDVFLSYTNVLIDPVNNTIYLPTYESFAKLHPEEFKDAAAISKIRPSDDAAKFAWQKLGYKVVPVETGDSVMNAGAIHCLGVGLCLSSEAVAKFNELEFFGTMGMAKDPWKNGISLVRDLRKHEVQIEAEDVSRLLTHLRDTKSLDKPRDMSRLDEFVLTAIQNSFPENIFFKLSERAQTLHLQARKFVIENSILAHSSGSTPKDLAKRQYEMMVDFGIIAPIKNREQKKLLLDRLVAANEKSGVSLFRSDMNRTSSFLDQATGRGVNVVPHRDLVPEKAFQEAVNIGLVGSFHQPVDASEFRSLAAEIIASRMERVTGFPREKDSLKEVADRFFLEFSQQSKLARSEFELWPESVKNRILKTYQSADARGLAPEHWKKDFQTSIAAQIKDRQLAEEVAACLFK